MVVLQKVKHGVTTCACGSVASAMSESLWSYGVNPTRLLCLWDYPGKNTRLGCRALPPYSLPRPFPTQCSICTGSSPYPIYGSGVTCGTFIPRNSADIIITTIQRPTRKSTKLLPLFWLHLLRIFLHLLLGTLLAGCTLVSNLWFYSLTGSWAVLFLFIFLGILIFKWLVTRTLSQLQI